MKTETPLADELVERVRERYGKIAEGSETGCCGPKAATACCGGDGALSLQVGYQAKDLRRVPEEANLGLGCGAPLDFLDLSRERPSSTWAPGPASTASWPRRRWDRPDGSSAWT